MFGALLIALVSDGLFLGPFTVFVRNESFYLMSEPVLSFVLSFFFASFTCTSVTAPGG